MRCVLKSIVLLALLLGAPGGTLAQAYTLPLDGTPVDIRVGRTDSRTIVLEGSSLGRSSQPVYLLAAAPPGATITVHAQQVVGTSALAPWALEFNRAGRFLDKIVFSDESIPSKLKALQGLYPGESIEELETRFGAPIDTVLRQELTTERAYLEVADGISLLQRDSCRERRTTLRVTIDLTRVAEERFLGDVVVAVALQLIPASADQRTLYKPYSERSPTLAVLLLALKNITGNIALMTRWRRGRPTILRAVALTESPYFGNGGIYARYYLARSKRAERVTVERITIDQQQRIVDAYGTCIELGERRQQMNGFR